MSLINYTKSRYQQQNILFLHPSLYNENGILPDSIKMRVDNFNSKTKIKWWKRGVGKNDINVYQNTYF